MELQYLVQMLVKDSQEQSEICAITIDHDFSSMPGGFNHQTHTSRSWKPPSKELHSITGTRGLSHNLSPSTLRTKNKNSHRQLPSPAHPPTFLLCNQRTECKENSSALYSLHGFLLLKILGQQAFAITSEFSQLNEMRETKRCLQMSIPVSLG